MATMLYPKNPLLTGMNLTSWNSKPKRGNFIENPRRRPSQQPLLKYDPKDIRYIYDKQGASPFTTQSNKTWAPNKSRGSALSAVKAALFNARNIESETDLLNETTTGNWRRLEDPFTGIPYQDAGQKVFETLSSVKRRLDKLKGLSPEEKSKLNNILLKEYAPVIAQFPTFKDDTGQDIDSSMFLMRMFQNSLTSPSQVAQPQEKTVDTQEERKKVKLRIVPPKEQEQGTRPFENEKTIREINIERADDLYNTLQQLSNEIKERQNAGEEVDKIYYNDYLKLAEQYHRLETSLGTKKISIPSLSSYGGPDYVVGIKTIRDQVKSITEPKQTRGRSKKRSKSVKGTLTV